jgi:Flp pilus assembly protein TadG
MRRRLGGEQGQGLLEVALIAPILLLLFLGVVDFSRFLYFQNTVTNASRVGAEMGTSHCPSPYACGIPTTATDDFVMQATVCEASPDVTLSPVIPCTPCDPTGGTGGVCTTPCSTACTPCPGSGSTGDVCITRGGLTTPYTGLSDPPYDIVVTVGYSFQPISPLMQAFFPDKSCWTGDDTSKNHHTLCSSATGRVS